MPWRGLLLSLERLLYLQQYWIQLENWFFHLKYNLGSASAVAETLMCNRGVISTVTFSRRFKSTFQPTCNEHLLPVLDCALYLYSIFWQYEGIKQQKLSWTHEQHCCDLTDFSIYWFHKPRGLFELECLFSFYFLSKVSVDLTKYKCDTISDLDLTYFVKYIFPFKSYMLVLIKRCYISTKVSFLKYKILNWREKVRTLLLRYCTEIILIF